MSSTSAHNWEFTKPLTLYLFLHLKNDPNMYLERSNKHGQTS